MIHEYSLRLLPHEAFDSVHLKQYLQREKGLSPSSITHIQPLRRSIDARQRTVYVNMMVRVFVNETPPEYLFEPVSYHDVSQAPSAVVVGAGPAGLFAALKMIELGVRPIVIERGKDVKTRKLDVAQLCRSGSVDSESNYCFGEGGAGAFSDGKLYTRSKKRGSVEKVLRVLCQHGAQTAILYDVHPHIGSDRLPQVIASMRETIISHGGEIHFSTRMTSLIVHDDKVEGVQCVDLSTGEERVFHGLVVLATGHSARDVYEYLHRSAITMEPKGIAVGVRLEHPSQLIDRIQYHLHGSSSSPSMHEYQYLPPAEYAFVTQAEGRGVYSFCMCPGGVVIPTATNDEETVVNGMSASGRKGRWSNSGMVVEVRPEDVEGDDVLRMLHYQEQMEHACRQQGGRGLRAPAQRMADFVNRKLSADLPASSYVPGLLASPLHFWMPENIVRRMQQGFRQFGKSRHGFLTNEAVMIGVETRTSAPLRVLRENDTLQHVKLQGLFPCGEGAGYAGGIVSAAIDGERCAEMLTERLNVNIKSADFDSCQSPMKT